MSNKEKLQIENNRTIDNINVIYLFKDGGSAWYSAYEWSAYLMEFFPNDLPDNKSLKLINITIITSIQNVHN